jgi:hypothetical protein
MLATFCLRLAWGLIVCTLWLPAAVAPPRFYRVQYLASLGLLGVAAFFLKDQADLILWLVLAGAFVLCFAGSVIWHVEGAPGGVVLGWLTSASLTAALLLGGQALRDPKQDSLWRAADNLAAGAVLGSATTAMLMGHSYLIAPAMSLVPLFRLLAGLGVALLVRAALACLGLWLMTRSSTGPSLEGDLLIWLPARWLLGLIGPLILGWMAWETTRIRSTQSATGILYVVTIFCFLGELTSQILTEKTSYLL